MYRSVAIECDHRPGKESSKFRCEKGHTFEQYFDVSQAPTLAEPKSWLLPLDYIYSLTSEPGIDTSGRCTPPSPLAASVDRKGAGNRLERLAAVPVLLSVPESNTDSTRGLSFAVLAIGL